MSGHRRKTAAHGKDSNHDEIVQALRKRGHLVQSLAMVGGGVPDLLVGCQAFPFPGMLTPRFVLLEVKDGRRKPSERKLTPLELAWHEAYRGWPVAVVECAEDAIAFVEAQ